MKEQSAAENINLSGDKLETVSSDSQPDAKPVKQPRDRKEDHFFKKEAQKRKRFSMDIKRDAENLLKATLGQDVFTREDQPIRLMDDKDDVTHSENSNNQNPRVGENFLEEKNNKKNTMGKESESLPSGGRTIQEQLAAKKDEIEKIIVSGNPESLTNGQIEQGAEEVVAEKAVEVKPEKKEVKQVPVAKPKEDRIKIVDVAGNQRKAADERIAELGQKLATAYKKSKSPKQEYDLTKPVKDEIFGIIEEQNPGWMKKDKRGGEERVRGEVVKVIEKAEKEAQEETKEAREKEKEKKEKLENLKIQLEETFKTIYEGYSNKGKEVPVELLKSLNDIKQDLFSVWPAWQKGGKGKQSSLGNFIEETKVKYRAEVKKEGKTKVAKTVEAIDKKDLPKTDPVVTVIEQPIAVNESTEKPLEKKIKPQPVKKSSIIAGDNYASLRNENQQEESKRIREELEKNKEDKERFEDIQEKIKKGKAIEAADVVFALEYTAREQKRIAEAEKKIAERAKKVEEIKPAPVSRPAQLETIPARIKGSAPERTSQKKIEPAVPGKNLEAEKVAETKKVETPTTPAEASKDEAKKSEELEAKAAKEVRMRALMEKYGIKSLEDLKKMGF